MESLILVRLDSKYCDYLRQFDKRVPYNYDKKELRPFIGVLFEVNDCKYFAPLSSPKPKHKTMKTTLDFLKIANGDLGAINFNNMLPVTNKNIIKLDLDKECLTKTEEKYTKMLKEQIFWLNRNDDKLYGRSKKLYDKYINGTLNESIAKRCCNFKLLEEKDLEGDTLQRMVEKILNDKPFTNKMKNNLKKFEVNNSATIIYDEIVKLVGNKDERNN